MGVSLGPVNLVRSLWRILRGRPKIPPSLQDNALLAVILRRRSIRSFSERAIADDVFAAILEAGRLAPSAVNLQTWAFAVFTAESWRTTFGSPLPFRGQRGVVVMGDTHRARAIADAFPASPLVEYTTAVMNASLAAMAMNIAAEALGVSSVMLSETGRSGILDAGYLKEKLALPDGVIDPIERISCKPNFMILAYPVITMDNKYTSARSRENVIGKDPSDKLIDELSVEKHVSSSTPATFIFTTDEDKSVPSENSVFFYLALRKAGVPAELHIYRTGKHGLNLAQQFPLLKSWPDLLEFQFYLH